MEVAIINKSNHSLPVYETLNSAGLDLRANLEEGFILVPMQRALIGTGLYIALPESCEAQIRPRSGLAYKKGITVLNAPGTIDADYRGEVKVLLINLSTESYTINNGDRIAQMVLAKFQRGNLVEAQSLDATVRGEGGFGSTGIH